MPIDWSKVPVHPFRTLPLLAARCTRCNHLYARYMYTIERGADQEAAGVGEWKFGSRKHCECDPAPTLPEGDELDWYVARARRAAGADLDESRNAVVTIRVR